MACNRIVPLPAVTTGERELRCCRGCMWAIGLVWRARTSEGQHRCELRPFEPPARRVVALGKELLSVSLRLVPLHPKRSWATVDPMCEPATDHGGAAPCRLCGARSRLGPRRQRRGAGSRFSASTALLGAQDSICIGHQFASHSCKSPSGPAPKSRRSLPRSEQTGSRSVVSRAACEARAAHVTRVLRGEWGYRMTVVTRVARACCISYQVCLVRLVYPVKCFAAPCASLTTFIGYERGVGLLSKSVRWLVRRLQLVALG